MTQFTLQLMGRFRLLREKGEEIESLGRKSQGLLAFLATNIDQPQSREKLATLLWGDRMDEQARHSLSQTISSLRKTLDVDGGSFFQVQGDNLALSSNDIQVDTGNFERLVQGNTRHDLEQAVALYGGEFLDGLVVNSDGFQTWLEGERTRLQDIAVDALRRLAVEFDAENETKKAVDYVKQAISIDPVREGSHCLLMRFYQNLGLRSAALQQFLICQDILRQELGADPGTEITQLNAEIKQASAGDDGDEPNLAESANAVETAAAKPVNPVVTRVPVVPVQNVNRLKIGAVATIILIAVAATAWTQSRVFFSEPAVTEKTPPKASIAVLPFENYGDAAEKEYLVDGITEDIITELSRFPSLFVIARNSTYTYKGKRVNAQKAGKDLGVRYILVGSVRKNNDQVRITAQLVDVTTGGHLWADRFDRVDTDVFALQDEVTQKIVAAMAIEVSKAELLRIQQKPTSSLEAYDHVLHGRAHLNRRLTRETNKKAKLEYEKAIEADPNYSWAYASLAWTHLNDWRLGWSTSRKLSLERAFKYAQVAIERSESNFTAHEVLAEVYLWNKQYDRAEAEILTAIALNPNAVNSLSSAADILTWVGKPEEAIGHIKQAMLLNPHFPFIYEWRLGHVYFVLGQYEKAIATLEKLRDRTPQFLAAHAYLAVSYSLMGRNQDARAAIDEVLKLNPQATISMMAERMPYKSPEDLNRVLDAARLAGMPN